MEDINYPKVFIILEPFNDTTGMGVTMTNLFKDWPQDRIAVAAYDLDVELCRKLRPCASYLSLSSPAHAPKIEVGKSSGRTGLLPKLRNIAKYFYNKLGFNDLRRIPISAELKKTIADFEPDIVFSALGDLKRIRFTEQIMNIYPTAKLALYIVDDWPNTKQNGRWFPLLWRRAYDRALRNLLDKAKYLFSICDAMSQNYLEQYGKSFIPFHNPVDIRRWNSIEPVRHYSDDVFSIVYVGKINRDTETNILTLAEVVDSLNKRGLKVVFDVYTPSAHNIDTSRFEGFSIIPPIANDRIPFTLKGYDAVYLTLGFSKESRAYTRLSMPTKLTEYLAAGHPILLHAPEEIAVSKYVTKTGSGLVCTSDSGAALEDCLLKLVNDPALRETLRRNSSELAKAHDIEIVRNNFKKALSA